MDDEDQPAETNPTSDLAWKAASALRTGAYQEALRCCDEAELIEERAGRQAGLASIWTIRGRVMRLRGDLEAAADALQRADDLRHDHGEGLPTAHTALEQGRLRLETGEPAAAMGYFVAAATGFARHPDPRAEAWAQLGVAAARHGIGDLDGSQRHTSVALAAAELHRDDSLRAAANEQLGSLFQELGRRLPAMRAWRQAEAAWHRVADEPGERRARLGVARARIDLGEDARGDLAALVDDAEPTEERWLLGLALSAHGAALGATGDRLAYTQLARADVLLRDHPSLCHLPNLDLGHLDLSRQERDAALRRFGAIPERALTSIPVRVALASLRRRAQQTVTTG